MITSFITHNVWLISDTNYRRSSVLKFPAPCGPVLTEFHAMKV